MKSFNIAAVTDDGLTISQHFGRARYYEVIFVEDGKVIRKERRDKLGHHNFAQEEHHHQSDSKHGFDESSHNKHVSMAEAVKDCSFVLARGMGAGAYQSMMQLNIKPIVTDVKSIDEAVHKVIDETIVDHIERLH